MKQILVVCTANVCRSPLVASLLQHQIVRAGLTDKLTVTSAGVHALAGGAVDPMIAAMLDELGIELAAKFATPVAEQALREADLVLVMEEAHRQALFYRLPSALPKVFLLSELAGRYDEVTDPHGGSEEEYRATLELVTTLLAEGWPQLLRRLDIKTPSATITDGA
ncbi:MAG TPA: low molecular weight protein arginine phosphatase [Chloroflexi bacterium]|nr:low molecular weight protein arginine phosphatase [Chloroflexota bacterium]